ncbi:hypothetical protein DDF62_14420 [Caulobacter radicis]|uniref:N-formylglutamate amidohydrolase n=1 Tax=Caulobacter radicis TaxID=2172650 RepID=UPI000D58492F|nr:N-formylglutamate amidohydrolase [Caulobacter radicis]PVM88389.1 hypothetical protein DDF62_14420 [Caulobacter radicis]
MTTTRPHIAATATAAPATVEILYCVPHASGDLPHWLEGRETEVLATHEGYDIGAYDLAVEMAARTGGEVVAAVMSRTVIDVNRMLNADAIPRCDQQGRPFAHNVGMKPGDLAARLDTWRGFHGDLGRTVEAALASGGVVLVDTHSFTRQLGEGAPRIVDIGVCAPEGGGFALRLFRTLEDLAASGRFLVQDETGGRVPAIRLDEPYPGAHPGAFIGRTYHRPGVDTVTLEVCDDLLRSAQAVDRVADLIVAAIAAALNSNQRRVPDAT